VRCAGAHPPRRAGGAADEEVYEETSQEPTFPKALEATQALVREILPDLPEDEQKFLTMHIGVVLAQS